MTALWSSVAPSTPQTEAMELICNQRNIPKDLWRYGLRSSAATGCGWIATYNALLLMGLQARPEALIRYYTRQLPLIHGNLGTSFWGPALCFRQWGFPVKVTSRRREFDAVVADSAVCILFYRWRRGLRLGAHFVALHQKQGRIIGYNTYRGSTGPDCYGTSLDAFLKQKGYFGAVLTGIQSRPEGTP